MNSLDLDISKYSNKELKEIFSIGDRASLDDINANISNYKTNILNGYNVDETKKEALIIFLNKALENLINDKKKNDESQNNIDKSTEGTFSQPYNALMEVSGSHSIIKDHNRIAGLKAKLFQGRVVDSGEYPPGYINPINIKTIKQAINIDTRFRPKYFNTTSSDFIVNLPEKFTKVVSMRLASLEMPTTVYAISEFRDNTTFTVDAIFNPLATWGYGRQCNDIINCSNISTSKWESTTEINPWARAQHKMINSFYNMLSTIERIYENDPDYSSGPSQHIELSTPSSYTNGLVAPYTEVSFDGGWPNQDSQEEYFFFANCKTPIQQASSAREWIEKYAKTFTSRYEPTSGMMPNNVNKQITKFFCDDTNNKFIYKYLRPGINKDNIFLKTTNKPCSSDSSKYPTTKELVAYFRENEHTIYSDTPNPVFFFPWKINGLVVKLPPGNYSSRVDRKNHTGCIEDTINSELYNVGLDPEFTICFSVNPIDGHSIFSRPSSKREYIIPQTEQSNNQPSLVTDKKCLVPAPYENMSGLQILKPQIPLIPNVGYDISYSTNKNFLFEDIKDYSCPERKIKSDISTSEYYTWNLGVPDSCHSQGIPLISSFKIRFNVDVDGKEDLQQPMPLKLGWQLGFRLGTYGLNEIAISEGICLITGPRYIYFCVNEFSNAANNYFKAAFSESILSPHILGRINYAKLEQDAGVFRLGEDDDYNTSLNRTREYFGPIEIQKLHFQILDEYGRVVRFNNMDWSCALMFDILYD